jgi:hypothetical protein
MNNEVEEIWKETVLTPTIFYLFGVLPVSSDKWRNSTTLSFEAITP